MFDSSFQSALMIMSVLTFIAFAWHLVLKGKKSADNLWLFLMICFLEYTVIASGITYFPFYNPLFFVFFLMFHNTAAFFTYSFPRSQPLNKWWRIVIIIANLSLVLIFIVTSDIIHVPYAATAVTMFLFQIFFIVRKIKYLASHEKILVTAIVWIVSGSNFFLSLFYIYSAAAYNVIILKYIMLLLFPVYLSVISYLFIRKMSNHANLTSFVFGTFFLLSLPFSIIFLMVSPWRVLLVSIFSVRNFVMPATLASCIIFSVIGYLIYYFSNLVDNYFNKTQLFYQRVITGFRKKADISTNYHDLFELLHETFLVQMKRLHIQDIKLYGDIDLGNNEFKIMSPKDVCEPLIEYFDETRESYILCKSVDTPSRLAVLLRKLKAEIAFPLINNNGVAGLFTLEARRLSYTASECIGTIGAIASDRFVKIGLFHEIMKREKMLQQNMYFHETGKMVSVIAHELRTPLTSIMFNLDVLSEDLQDVSSVDSEFLEIAKKELKRLNDTVEKMLIYGRDIQLETDEGSVEQFLKEIVGVFKGSDVTVEYSNFTGESYLLDWDRLKHVFINLINNSIQAIEKSNSGDTISITVSENKKRLQFVIRDNGPGVPEKIADTLFEPFVTTRKEGNGLGLAICEKILKIMGGNISLSETSDEGTVFTVLVPLKTT